MFKQKPTVIQIIQFILALVIILTVIYFAVSKLAIPEALLGAIATIAMYYFGAVSKGDKYNVRKSVDTPDVTGTKRSERTGGTLER